MTSTYNKINRLKAQNGWTWEHFFQEITLIHPPRLDEKTLYNHYRHPHHGGKHHVINIIDQLHQKYFPDPFPDDINGLMRLYNNLLQNARYNDQEEDIRSLETFAQAQVDRDPPQQFLRRCRWYWLLANIAFDRIPYLRENAKQELLIQTRDAAIKLYEKAIAELERHNLEHTTDKIEERYLFKLRQNALACFINSVIQEKRSQDPEILNYIKDANFIEYSKKMLEIEPFHWVIARNGLRFSSLLQDPENCRQFFTRLVSSSKHFIDLNYKPLDYISIAAGSDYVWAIDNVLTPEYLNELKALSNIKNTQG